MNWLAQIAPTIASALGGPLAGLAVTAVSKALGINESEVTSTIESGKLSADQISQIKIAELQLKEQAQTLGLNFETLAVEDRKSAREMQIATHSWIPGTLAIGITLGFFGILVSLMTGYATKSDELMIMLGSLGTAWTEDEFWEAHEIEYSEESECPSCKAERENKCCSDCESCDGCCDDEEEEQPKLVKPTKVDKNLN